MTPIEEFMNSKSLSSQSHELFHQQQREWKLLRDGCEAMQSVRTRTIDLGDFQVRLQFNPARLANASAKVDAKSIAERKCFLCPAHLPPEQRAVPFADDFLILANPFPIFPEHFTIPHRRHIPQRIRHHFGTFLDLAVGLGERYTTFYNGPKCGASAPDHLHFQAGDKGFMPIEAQYEKLKGPPAARAKNVTLFVAGSTVRPFLGFESSDRDALAAALETFYRVFDQLRPAEDEPMMNILAGFENDTFRVIVFPRARHRPDFFYAEGDAKILLSPGSVDLGGVCILPVERDFERLTRENLIRMFGEVMLSNEAFAQLTRAIVAGLSS